jgi:hypothetical protein
MSDLSTSGAGVVDSLTETVTAITNFDSPGDVLDVGLGAASVGIDALALMENPVDTLATSAIAWMIDNLSFLRWPLDVTVGNPDMIDKAVQALNKAAADLDTLAGEQADALGTQVPTYREGGSTSAVTFGDVMNLRVAQLRGASLACAGAAEAYASAGVWVATVRACARDMIADFIWDLLQKAATHLAAGPMTFGASVAEFVASTVQRAAMLVNKIGDMFATALNRLKILSKRLAELSDNLNFLFGGSIDTVGRRLALPGPLKPFMEFAKEDAKSDSVATSTADESDQDTVDRVHEQQASAPVMDDPEWWTKKGYL